MMALGKVPEGLALLRARTREGEGEPAELSTKGPKGTESLTIHMVRVSLPNSRAWERDFSLYFLKNRGTRPRLRGRGEVALSGLARPKEGEARRVR